MPTGPERVRAAVELDRGMGAPTAAEIAWFNQRCGCGRQGPCATDPDAKRWPGTEPTKAERLTNAITGALFCSACLRPRFHPGHWLSCR